MPFALVPFLLLVVPIVEIAAFIAIGGQIGIVVTLLLIFVTAVVGTILLRIQGFQLLNRIRQEMEAGRIPGRALGDGAMILLAGVLLLTPGFVTDAIGFSLFVPPVRSAIWSLVASRISIVVPGGATFKNNQYENPSRQADHDGPVIDLDDDEYRTGESDADSPWNPDKKS